MDMNQNCTCNCMCNNGHRTRKTKQKTKLEWSKKLIADVRVLLWIITIGGLALAAYCVYKGFQGSLPWISAMVGLPWTAHGTICSFYLNMAKSDHREGGITFEQARANNFNNDVSRNSPKV